MHCILISSSQGYIQIMLPRLIFVLFTIVCIAYTWFHTGKAKSCHAVNETKGTCKCEAKWKTKDQAGNLREELATYNFQACEDECSPYAQEIFCNDSCNKANTPEEKNALCPGRKSRFTGITEYECSCPFDIAAN
jgi:hypothetical protein